MSKPYQKYDDILKRDLTASERLEKQLCYLRFSVNYIEQFQIVIKNLSNDLTEEQLQTICDAVDSVLNASSNAAFLGMHGYEARPVKMVEWGETA